MDTFTAQAKTIASAGGDTYWAQTYTHGNFFLSLEISGSGALPKGMAFLEALKQSLLSHPPKTLAAFRELLSLNQTNFPAITFAAGLLIDRILYAATTEGGSVYIARDHANPAPEKFSKN